MATSPFFRVLEAGSGRDLTDFITSFTFEDCTAEDDLLKLTMRGVNVEMIEDKALRKGNTLLYSWGYLGGAQSPQHQCVITAVEPDFGATLTINISATDSGIVLKKNNSAKTYQGKTSSQIANEIAKKHGLKAKVDVTTDVHKSIPQAGKTDFELLKYLASHEASGLFRFFIKGDTLNFTRIDLKQPSRRTFRWNDGSGVVLSFRPRDNDSLKKAASAEARVPGIDPRSGASFLGKSKEGEAKNDPKLGNFRVHYNADGEEVGRSKVAPAPTASRTIVTPAGSAAAAGAIADKEKKSAAMDDITAELRIIGDPVMAADGVITVEGVGPTYGGNWYVRKVTHTLGAGPYLCSLSLARNAANKAASSAVPKNTDKNTTTGPEKAQTTREVRVKYDQNSIRVN